MTIFACAREWDSHVLLGSHDAYESWTLNIGRERNDLEQFLVSQHEKKHQELNEESPWGFVVMLACAAAQHENLFRDLARRCKQVHEVFATYNSVGTDPQFLALLSGAPSYVGFYERAVSLADGSRGLSPRFADAVLRSSMAPGELVGLGVSEILSLHPSGLADSSSPDRRLRRIERLVRDSPPDQEWLDELEMLPVDLDGLSGYRDAVVGWLNQSGISSMTTSDHQDWVHRLVAEIESRADADRFRLEVVTAPPADKAAALVSDMSRERLQIHDSPLPLEFVDPDDLVSRARDFARTHADLGAHSLVVWMRHDLLQKQFIVENDFPGAGRPVLGLVACDRVNAEPTARICVFQASPAILFRSITSNSRVVFVTTLSTIVDATDDDDLRGVAPVFALLDQPLLEFCVHTVEHGSTLRWRRLTIDGDRSLSLFVLENSLISDVFFLYFCAGVARHHFDNWLRQNESPYLLHSASFTASHDASLSAAVEHILGTFWRLDQFGGRR